LPPQALSYAHSPGRVGLSKFFKEYPVGAIENYTNDNAYRTTDAELRAKEREAMSDPDSPFNYQSIRKAAEVHRQVRTYAKEHIKPGMRMTEIAEMIEDAVRALAEEDPEDKLKAGVGFPTGLSRNHVAAHYTPNVRSVSKLFIGV
jgi:methionyl aminopeptidase